MEAVRIVRDSALQIGKGFAFVLFKTKVRCLALVHSGLTREKLGTVASCACKKLLLQGEC